ncbi:sensor histidine kinase [Streptomyces millisiae]|uniref:Oxygen sensor histidine kinase NreB n=1 Tax=Streptomyces millisiae TaxID=3075542 RepID=A0ABU2LUE9_9ACTN|nr:sensor histidine kinase [Streptomyces sp. DSM 44918]MDT0321216.1 sensor histidine kinase [Streptomyces sp. DSM 44918]
MRDVSEIAKRWALFDRWGPHALLAVGLLLAAVTADELGMSRAARVATASLAVAAVVLQLCWHRAAAGPSVAGACFYFARWAIALALTCLNPFFGVYAVHGYFSADRQLPRPLVRTGLYATAVVMALSNVGGPEQLRSWGPAWAVYAALLGMHIGLVHVFAHLAAKEQAQAEAQVAFIAELEDTNTALQQALDENAALHAQLVVQAREAGIADERRRLAAEIHDTIAQGLTGIIAQLQAVEKVDDPAVVQEHVHRAARLARHSLGEARRSVHNLAPVDLEHDALPTALRRTVVEWSERTGVRAEFTLAGASRQLHNELAATLLRIAQEALSNAARHARPSRVGVTLTFVGPEVMLDVRDDGLGFDPSAVPARSHSRGFGLAGMRARAERVAGSLSVESEPGLGTAVSARVPLVDHD